MPKEGAEKYSFLFLLQETFQKLEISNEVANLGKEIGVYGFPTGSEFLNLTTGVISAKKYINGYLHIQNILLI